ncbi:MAG: CHAT domain-containing protein [Telluria sp.]
MIYQNFDLEIICPQGGNRLCARVLESPQGDCPFIDVKWPFDAETENRLLSEIYGGLRQRHGRSIQANSIQDFGGKLFEAVFSGDIEHLFRSSLDTSFREGKGLRIRLRLPEDSELHMRPWEFLFDTESREFLAVREHTPLVRYLPVAQPIPPITVEGPLRVLVALSSPTDHPRLDIAREWEILCHALEPSISAGQLVLRRVPGHCTFDNLRDSLRHFGAHIFHFVGHGIPGALVLEQESGKGLEMEATHLRSAFPSGALPRLIVLNACSGAITQDVPFSGLAQGFLRQGVPAVVAMQASITDDAAMIFTRYFYRDLVEIGAVDASLTEARLRMQGNGHPIEWGTPVLYMRALSGQLFRPAANPVAYPEEAGIPREPPVKVAAPPPHAEPHLYEQRKKTREMPAKQDVLPLAPGAAQGERKKTRVVRVKENVPQLKPGPDPEQQGVPPRAALKESTPPAKPAPDPAAEDITAKLPPQQPTPPSTAPSPPAQQAPPPTVHAPALPLPPRPEPEPAEQVSPARIQPPEYTSHSRPQAYPGAQDAAPQVPARPTLPLTPEPKPVESIILPKVEPKPEPKVEPKPAPKVESKPAPKAEPKVEPTPGMPPADLELHPAGQDMAPPVRTKPVSPPAPAPTPPEGSIPPKAEPKASTAPLKAAPRPAAPPIAPKVQAEEFTVPLPAEPKPAERHIPPKAEARQHAPPTKLEPKVDEEQTLWNAQPRPSVPIFTFDPDPELEQQGIMGAAGKPKAGAPAQAADPAHAHAQGRKRVRVVAMAGLLAAVGIAIGVVKFLPSTPGTPEALPSSRAPITPVATVPPTARPGPTAVTVPMAPATSSPPTAESVAAPVVRESVVEDKPDPLAQAGQRQTKPRPVAETKHKSQSTRKPATTARSDKCKSAVVSERPASCLFKKQ